MIYLCCCGWFSGHIEAVNILLKYGCDVNLKDADSRTTLYILALENKLKIVKYLLEHSNINVNIPDSEGRTALHVAAWQGHLEMVKVLITQGKISSITYVILIYADTAHQQFLL